MDRASSRLSPLRTGQLLGNTPYSQGGDGTHNCQWTLQARLCLKNLSKENMRVHRHTLGTGPSTSWNRFNNRATGPLRPCSQG